MAKIILDNIENIYFDNLNPPIINFHAIKYLGDGIIWLGESMKTIEENYRNSPLGKGNVFAIGVNDSITTCAFQ